MLVLIVGQGPSASSEGLPPFDPSTYSGRKLCELAGVERAEELGVVVNLLDRYPGRSRKGSKGDHFFAWKARQIAKKTPLHRFDRVVLVGRNVARSFGVGDRPFLRWFEHRGTKVSIVPHPSGVNHWWNDPRNVRRARRFVRRLAPAA